MKLFYINNVEHLAKKIKIKKGKFVIKKFSDGEIHVKINEDVRNKLVCVIAATNAPADNLLKLMFLLDALKNAGAKINLLITYFAYSRQDKIKKGEALTSKRICSWLKDFRLRKIIVLHMHGKRLKKFLSYKDLIIEEFFCSRIKKGDVIVAPDKGAVNLAKRISKVCGSQIAVVEKVRIKDKVKSVNLRGDIKRRRVVIVDDMITTGGTIIAASKLLKKKGAKEILAISTHGVFSEDAVKRLEKSAIKKIYVTNSLPQRFSSRKIKVVNIVPFLEKQMK